MPTPSAAKLDAIVFPTVPKVALAANAGVEQPADLPGVIQNTDPGSNAGVPGLQMPMALGVEQQAADRPGARRPVGQRPAADVDRLALEPVLGRLPPPAK